VEPQGLFAAAKPVQAIRLSGAGGSAASTRTLQWKADWAEAQRTRLWAALDCIGKGSQADIAAELDHCLPVLVSSLRP